MRIAPVANYELDLVRDGAVHRREGRAGRGSRRRRASRLPSSTAGSTTLHAALGGAGDPRRFRSEQSGRSSSRARSRPRRSWAATTSSGARGPAERGRPPRRRIPIRSTTVRSSANVGVGHGTHVARTSSAARVESRPASSLYAVKVCSTDLHVLLRHRADPGHGVRRSTRTATASFKDRDATSSTCRSGSTYGQPFDDDLSARGGERDGRRHPDGRLGGQRLGQAIRDGNAGRDEDWRSRSPRPRFRPRSCRSCRSSRRHTIAGNVPAVFQPWSAPLTAPIQATAAVRQWRGRQSERLCGVSGRFADGQDRSGGSRRLQLHAQDQQRRRRRRVDRHHRAHRAGRPVRRRRRRRSPDHHPRLHGQPGCGSNRLTSRPAEHGSEVRSERRRPAGRVRWSAVHRAARSTRHAALIKPEIGAPGASVSAIAGTGTGTGPFGGTSGAAPMVAGSAALVLASLSAAPRPPRRARRPGRRSATALSPARGQGPADEHRRDRTSSTTR